MYIYYIYIYYIYIFKRKIRYVCAGERLFFSSLILFALIALLRVSVSTIALSVHARR